MRYFIGLDVSMKETSVCIVDENDKIIREASVDTEPWAIHAYIKKTGLTIEKIALESGSLTHWLVDNLCKLGLPAIAVCSRQMEKILSTRINKTDRNDARGIAQALRAGFYREVHHKSQEAVEIKVLIATRRVLIKQRNQLKGSVRGLLKTYGIRIGTVSAKNFNERVAQHIKDKPKHIQLSINTLLRCCAEVSSQLEILDHELAEIAKKDEDIKRLMTIPGVGVITAITFKAEIDDPSRFSKSRMVGAYFGMTSREHSSGETVRLGSISKCGSKHMRYILCEAAACLLYRSKLWSKLKAWGMKVLKKRGHKKAMVAVGRKLAVIMHRMLVDKTEFIFGEPKEAKVKAA